MSSIPSAEEQLAFLTKVQRLLNESDFSSTYKYALLISLADLAIELGKDDNSELELSNRQIAERFIELYWQQSSPYKSLESSQSGVLYQNNGIQAAIVKAIEAFRQSNTANSPEAAKRIPSYKKLVTTVATTVQKQPIQYLQNVGGGTLPFIYEQQSSSVLLKPGAAYCLRQFQPLIQQLARHRWTEFIKRNTKNIPMLGKSDDLEGFLFETSRKTLTLVGNSLKKVYGKCCFYCARKLTETDVDHFIPFSLYPRDLMHNFVLSCPTCNRSKSDSLAAKKHLYSWQEQANKHNDLILEIASEIGMAANQVTSLAVTKWSYDSAVKSQTSGWVKPGQYERLWE